MFSLLCIQCIFEFNQLFQHYRIIYSALTNFSNSVGPGQVLHQNTTVALFISM